jgi:D-lactate dehydrogenase
MKVLVYSTHNFDKPFLEEICCNPIELHFTEQSLSIETVGLAEGFEAIALFSSDKADAETLEKLFELGVRYIALRSVGYDHVDLIKAKELGIKVANVPSYSPYAIAEHAVAMLLALNRKLLKSQELFQQNDFRLDELVGFDLYHKTIGVVGTGKIGSAFARIMNGFGCRLLAYDPVENIELSADITIKYVSLETLCKESDVIALHCPLNKSNHYLFDKIKFDLMKDGVFFINTARGGLVNTEQLLEAIDNGKVAAAGLDVYENEKKLYFKNFKNKEIEDTLFEKLRNNKKVLLTGHQAFLTNEALKGIADTTQFNIKSWMKTGKSINDLIC